MISDFQAATLKKLRARGQETCDFPDSSLSYSEMDCIPPHFHWSDERGWWHLDVPGRMALAEYEKFHFECATCHCTVPNDNGASDEYPYDCDACANKKHEADRPAVTVVRESVAPIKEVIIKLSLRDVQSLRHILDVADAPKLGGCAKDLLQDLKEKLDIT